MSSLKETLDDNKSFKRNQETANSLDIIFSQLSKDSELLKAILVEVQSIEETTQNYGLLMNALFTAVSGRAQTIKLLESQLLQRVQMVTAFLVKDVWKVN